MRARTIFLSRLIGLFAILVSLAVLVRRPPVQEIVTAFINDAPLTLLTGILTLIGGLAMILTHNIWSGGARTIVVTLIGWLLLLRGFLVLTLPPQGIIDLVAVMRADQLFYLYLALWAALGVFLVWPRPEDRTQISP